MFMKNLWLILLCLAALCTSELNAQEGIEIRKGKQKKEKSPCQKSTNLFKVDLVALAQHDYKIGYERNVSDQFSFVFNTTYTNRSIQEFNEAEFAKNKQFGFAIAPEFRHYVLSNGQTMAAPSGPYYATFVEYERRSKQYVSYNTNLAEVEFDKALQENNVAIGTRIGFQKHIWKGLYVDVATGTSWQNNKITYKTREVTNQMDITQKTDEAGPFIDLKTDTQQKIGFDATIKIGFAF